MATLKQAAELMKEKKEFKSGNVFAFDYPTTGYYIVFSYGIHWPLFVYDHNKGLWYGNKDEYSITTSKHFNKLNPGNIVPLGIEEMESLVGAASSY